MNVEEEFKKAVGNGFFAKPKANPYVLVVLGFGCWFIGTYVLVRMFN